MNVFVVYRYENLFLFFFIFMYIGTATGSSIKRTNFTLFLGLKSR